MTILRMFNYVAFIRAHVLKKEVSTLAQKICFVPPNRQQTSKLNYKLLYEQFQSPASPRLIQNKFGKSRSNSKNVFLLKRTRLKSKFEMNIKRAALGILMTAKLLKRVTKQEILHTKVSYFCFHFCYLLHKVSQLGKVLL